MNCVKTACFPLHIQILQHHSKVEYELMYGMDRMDGMGWMNLMNGTGWMNEMN